MFLVTCLLVTLVPTVSQDLPRGRCIWAAGLPADLNAWLSSCGDDAHGARAAEKAYDRHTRMHGWSGAVDGVDLVPMEQGAVCPSEVLDQLAGATRWCDDVRSAMVIRKTALCLERNGRVTDALAVLDHAIANIARESPSATPRVQYSFGNDVSGISSTAARLAAKHGLWTPALDYSAEWEPTPMMCSLDSDLELVAIDRFRTRCRIGMGDTDGARQRCVESLRMSGQDFSEVAWLWLQSFEADGEPIDPEDALELLACVRPGVNGSVLIRIANCWRAARVAPSEVLRSTDLVTIAPESVLRQALRNADGEALSLLVVPLLDDNAEDLDRTLASLLWQTGHDEVGRAIEHARDVTSDKRARTILDFYRENWRERRAWLDELSLP